MNSLESSVMHVLNSPSVRQMKYFQIGNHSVSPSLYTDLSKRFKNTGLPYIKYYPPLGSTGQYEPAADSLWFNFPVATTLTQKSVIIHEATHAALDMQNGAPIMIGEAEALAYVAQCQYYVLNNTDPEARLMDSAGQGTKKDLVFELAMNIAVQLIQYHKPSADDYFQLRQAVANDPEYYRDYFTIADYHGIG